MKAYRLKMWILTGALAMSGAALGGKSGTEPNFPAGAIVSLTSPQGSECTGLVAEGKSEKRIIAPAHCLSPKSRKMTVTTQGRKGKLVANCTPSPLWKFGGAPGKGWESPTDVAVCRVKNAGRALGGSSAACLSEADEKSPTFHVVGDTSRGRGAFTATDSTVPIRSIKGPEIHTPLLLQKGGAGLYAVQGREYQLRGMLSGLLPPNGTIFSDLASASTKSFLLRQGILTCNQVMRQRAMAQDKAQMLRDQVLSNRPPAEQQARPFNADEEDDDEIPSPARNDFANDGWLHSCPSNLPGECIDVSSSNADNEFSGQPGLGEEEDDLPFFRKFERSIFGGRTH